MIQLIVQSAPVARPLKTSKTKALAAALSERFAQYSGTISARVIPAEAVRALNRDYAGKDEPTDVLSFSYVENRHPELVSGTTADRGIPKQVRNDNGDKLEMGDIVISREHIASQAAAAGTTEETEFILLLLHGCLHTLGHDHQTAGRRQAMDQLQAMIMTELCLHYRNFGWLA